MPSRIDDAEVVDPGSRARWRAWLAEHHATSTGAWVVTANRRGGEGGLDYEDLVLEALCVGWVDSTARSHAPGQTRIYVAPRRKGSTWARSNKARVARLLEEGLMLPAGTAAIEAAKDDGSWTVLDSVEALEVPEDLAAALAAAPGASAGFASLSASARKQLLYGVASAKRAPTRQRRVAAAVAAALEVTPRG